MKEIYNSNFENYRQEARERWGETAAYKEYEAKHSSEDKRCDDAMNEIFAEFALCMKNGNNPESDEALNLVKTLQTHITEKYYRCTNDILACLGQMYVADDRFRNNIDKNADGTAEFVCKAISVYCR